MHTCRELSDPPTHNTLPTFGCFWQLVYAVALCLSCSLLCFPQHDSTWSSVLSPVEVESQTRHSLPLLALYEALGSYAPLNLCQSLKHTSPRTQTYSILLGWEDLQHMNNSIIHILSPHSFHWVRSKYGYQRLSEYQSAEMDSATQPAHWCLNINTYLICYKYDAMQRETCFYTHIQTYKLRLLSLTYFQISLSYLLKETAVKHGLNGNLSTKKTSTSPKNTYQELRLSYVT